MKNTTIVYQYGDSGPRPKRRKNDADTSNGIRDGDDRMTLVDYEEGAIKICMDGNNIGYYGGGQFDYNNIAAVIQALDSSKLHFSCHLFIPSNRASAVKEQGFESISIEYVPGTWKRPKRDDEACISHCLLWEGYYLTRDAKMHSHIKNPIISEAYKERRIGFTIRKGSAKLQMPPDLMAKSLLCEFTEHGEKEVKK